MVRWVFALSLLIPLPLAAGPGADLARAIREGSFDREECYRVRDLSLTKEDIKFYFADGHLIFSKPVAGRRIAAVFVADVEGGDAEVILLPPDRGERRSLATYTHSPNMDEHFRTAMFLFSGDDYAALMAQLPANPTNKRAPEVGALLDDEYTPTLRSLGSRYLTRMVLDLLNGPARNPGLFVAFISGTSLGNFDVVLDPSLTEQVTAGQISTRNNRLYFDSWTSFTARSERRKPSGASPPIALSDYRIEATIAPDLSLSAVTRVKVRTTTDDLAAVSFDITPLMSVTSVLVDGHAAEVLQRDSLRSNAIRGGNDLFLVVPPEHLRAGRQYEFEFHHSGTVVYDAGDHVLYVSARGNWYPSLWMQFANYDLTFRYPSDLDLAAPGELVEDRTDGEWHITHRRTLSAIRTAGFNLGDYVRARVEHNGYVVEVCANREVERNLKPPLASVAPAPLPNWQRGRRVPDLSLPPLDIPIPDPLARLKALAADVASALEFMTARFGPPAMPHLVVSPIPGTFGQGFPGLIYLSTLSYLKSIPGNRASTSEMQQIFFRDILQVHETAHQWWGNRVSGTTYRDNWLMEALANYSALYYLEKTKGPHAVEVVLESYRAGLLEKGASGQTVESAGPITMGGRLDSSLEPAAWRAITYGKGTWIMQMLRRRMGDERFFAMLAEILKRYDHGQISTDEFRRLAAQFLPPKTDDPQLETFFDEWVYGTGIPALKLTYEVKGTAPSLRLTGRVTQSDVDPDFAALVPVEIRVAGGHSITEWVRCGNEPATFTVALKQAPLKVTLDPNRAVLRR